jgi:hypothetical protein
MLFVDVVIFGQHGGQHVARDRLDGLVCPDVTGRAPASVTPFVVQDDAFAVVEQHELADPEVVLARVAVRGRIEVTDGSEPDDTHDDMLSRGALLATTFSGACAVEPAMLDGRRRDIRTQLSDTGWRGVRCAQRHEAEGPNGFDGVGQVADRSPPHPGASTVDRARPKARRTIKL